MVKDKKLVATGISVLSFCGLCCIAPFLAIGLGSLGIGFLTGYLNYITISIFALLLGVTFYIFKNETSKPLCSIRKCKCCSS